MPFDGVEWGEPIRSSALASYPGAALTALGLFASHVNALVSARRNGVLMLCQSYEWNERTGLDGSGGRWISETTHSSLGGGYAWIDSTFTHVTALALVDAVATFDTAFHLRVVATDAAATTATGADVEFALDANATAASAGRTLADYIGRFDNVVLGQAEVALSTLSLPSRCIVTAQGYVGNAGNAGFCRPRALALYLECRG